MIFVFFLPIYELIVKVKGMVIVKKIIVDMACCSLCNLIDGCHHYQDIQFNLCLQGS